MCNMKYVVSVIFLSCFLLTNVKAQNLVPNPDFELRDFDYCGISSSSDLENALSDWYSPTSGSPDVFFTDIASSCWNFQPISTYPGPIGLKGEQLPRSGSSMVGIFLHTIATFDQREYLQIQLSSPLVSGGKYLVECYVSLADYTEFASNGLGFHLSTTAISSSNDDVLAYTPQYAVTNTIGVTQDWVRVFDTITVTDAFDYLTIGNFGDDASTTTEVNPTASFAPGTYGAYYFIDDVRVERVIDDPTASLNQLDILNVSIFPNPTTDEIHIELPVTGTIVEIELMDAHGKIVWSVKDSFKKYTVDMKGFEDGIYFIRVESESATYSGRIVKL